MDLGITVQDRVTGFQGVVTGFVQYLTGCNQALVVPRVGPDGAAKDAAWFDVQRLDRVGNDRIVLDNGRTPGCDMAPPKR